MAVLLEKHLYRGKYEIRRIIGWSWFGIDRVRFYRSPDLDTWCNIWHLRLPFGFMIGVEGYYLPEHGAGL